MRSALEFGRLSFGGASLGNLFHAVDDDQAEATLQAVWDLGIRYFDTSPHYGLGLSERRIGEFLAGKPRDEFLISTKVGRLFEPTPERSAEPDDTWFVVPATARRIWDYSADGIRRSLEDSLARLGLDRVDILYLHDPEQYDGVPADIPGALDALAGLRDEGLVSAVGVGTSDVGILRSAVAERDIDLAMVSNRYTLLDPRGSGLSGLCRERGVGIVNVGVFNSGILATAEPQADAHFEYGPASAAMREHATRLAAVCARHGVELPAAALQYSLRDAAVRTVVVGSADPGEMRQNAERMAVDIPEELWDDLAAQGFIPA